MSKVRVKEIKRVIGSSDINGMFEEMMGIRDAESDIIIPKMVNVRNTLRYLYKVFIQFSTFADLRNNFPEIITGLDEIKRFADEFKESTCLNNLQDEKEDVYSGVENNVINDLYRKIKENKHVKSLIIMCNKLDKYKYNFTNITPAKENFVNQEPGLSFKIFNFSSLDLKILWSNEKMKSSVKKYILMVLSKLHEHAYNLYKIITSPDVDVEKFTSVLMSSINELRKNPELHRCKLAFARIEKSVELLKEKFSDYYRESIASENPNSLVTSFIVDVSNQGGADAKLTREFRIIIRYMNKVSEKSGKNKDPNVQKIMKMLNYNYSLMESHTPVIEEIDENSCDLEESKDLGDLDLTTKEEKANPSESNKSNEEKSVDTSEPQEKE